MANLQDIINLAKADGGKFFVIDEQGDVKLVIMNVENYQEMLLGKLKRQIVDVENINQEIIKAQLQEIENTIPVVETPKPSVPKVEIRQDWRAQNSNHFQPNLGPTERKQNGEHNQKDLREEVIDPSFDFEGPKLEIDDL
jgi:hypothetical protein